MANVPTTCACPDFSYIPTLHAGCVRPLFDCGGIFLGKTNLDQFASGLVGTRSPYGVPSNSFDDRFVPGGSSSGSAVAVASGLVTFALGTDTAGSGRVPAGLNGIVGVKPSLGRFSTSGVVPACYLLDCSTVFALNVPDGQCIARLMENNDISDKTWRPRNQVKLMRQYIKDSTHFKFAIPSKDFLRFHGEPGGDEVARQMEHEMQSGASRLESLGGQRVEIDFTPFAETAILLYGAAFVAERYSGIRSFLEKGKTYSGAELADVGCDTRLLPVIASIIAGASCFSSADVFDGLRQLTVLKARARLELEKIDVLVVPTAAYNYTVAELDEQECKDHGDVIKPTRNANLGRFTNFVNLLDMCGLSVPSGVLMVGEGSDEARRHHLKMTGKETAVVPFGITLLAPAWQDTFLAGIGMAYETLTGLKAGPLGHTIEPYITKSKT